MAVFATVELDVTVGVVNEEQYRMAIPDMSAYDARTMFEECVTSKINHADQISGSAKVRYGVVSRTAGFGEKHRIAAMPRSGSRLTRAWLFLRPCVWHDGLMEKGGWVYIMVNQNMAGCLLVSHLI